MAFGKDLQLKSSCDIIFARKQPKEREKAMIRRAEKKDIDRLEELLRQVLELHAEIRPDIFLSGTTKYTAKELEEILADEEKPIFVATDEKDCVIGYAFCVLKRQPFSTNMRDFTTLFVDDLCVDQNCRGEQVGRRLFDAVVAYAKERGCYDVTLNVWEGNKGARAFYEKMGMFPKETQMELILP